MRPILLIPARLASARLPEKILADIQGKPMIVHVWERAMAAKLGPVHVACDSTRIADAITAAGGNAILTDPSLPSGSDRIHAALTKLDAGGDHDVVINVQGDMPGIDPAILRRASALLENEAVDIGTLACPITEAGREALPNVVKPILSFRTADTAQALYFTRATAPHGNGAYYEHIGLYTYRRSALERFVSLPPSALEKRESLEQLRALEAGMRIDVAIVPNSPLSVDTPEDLSRARDSLKP